jgi:hypothetical protein
MLALGKEPWRFKNLEYQLNMCSKKWQADQQKQIIAKMAGKMPGKSNDGKRKNNKKAIILLMVVAVAVAREIMAEEDADEGIDKYYSHWSRQNNVAGKKKIVTALSMMQLKNQSGSFLTYLKLKGVHINYAQLGMVETVTLGWIGQARPSFVCRDDTKDLISKLMKSVYPNMQYGLSWAFHYVADKKVKMTTRGIALQIMKHDDVPVVKF